MDLATVVAKLFDHPHPGTHHQRERTHLECFTQPCSIDLLCRTILSLLRERNSNSGRDSGKKFMKQSQPDRVDWTVRRRANRAKQLRYLYTSISSTSQQSYRTISDDKVSRVILGQLSLSPNCMLNPLAQSILYRLWSL